MGREGGWSQAEGHSFHPSPSVSYMYLKQLLFLINFYSLSLFTDYVVNKGVLKVFTFSKLCGRYEHLFAYARLFLP